MDDVNIGECFIEDRLVRLREVEIEPLGNRSHNGDVMLRHIEAVGAIRAKGHADDLMALLAQGIRIAQRRRGCAIGVDGHIVHHERDAHVCSFVELYSSSLIVIG